MVQQSMYFKDQAVREISKQTEREYQERLQGQLDTYNSHITEFQTENDRIRASYENRLEELLKSNKKKK